VEYTTYDAARLALGDWIKTNPDWPDSRDPAFHPDLFRHKITPQDFELAMVCHICAFIDEEEPYAVAAAFGQVIMNRTPENGSPYQTASKMMEPCTFDPRNHDIIIRLLHNVENLVSRQLYDPTNGATHYLHINAVAPGAAQSSSRVTIGRYIFI